MAVRWTEEQLQSINLEGSNIIVSAGAGSGKTAVLSERVLRKVKENTHIDRLLILTFTNAAAKEMKERIRKKLIENNLVEDVNLIDSAYITTFDSFSLSIVKKYHTNLNVTNKIGISSESIITIKKYELLEEIFNNYYTSSNELFHNFIKDFCIKDDKKLISNILKISNKLDMKYDKEKYLETYINKYFSDNFIKERTNEYFLNIKNLINELKYITEELTSMAEDKYVEKLLSATSFLFRASCYNDLALKTIKLPSSKTEDEEEKNLKEKMSTIKKEIESLLIYSSEEEMIEEFISTKNNAIILIEILEKLDIKLKEYKNKENIYDFNDIAKMAIKVVEENDEIKEELKNKFSEIMVDEYQDTNDIQEYFISLISNKNVYMVGDIKQSIYRFRNANPYIFKNKYDNYSNHNGGEKIDLNRNFRSRMEVLDNINYMFDYLMDDNIGGADYKKSHQMIFGNKTYIEKGLSPQDYNLNIYSYTPDKEFTNEEKEIFIIANDIKEKIASNYKIFDKDTSIIRNVEYSDFVILLDRKTAFNTYKKIFEYMSIPLTLFKDEDIKQDNDILIIKNILKLSRLINKEELNQEFKYLFLSLGRSYLFQIKDEILFDYFYNNNFKDNEIYNKCLELSNYLDTTSPSEVILKIEEIFEYEKHLFNLSNISTQRLRYEYFYNLVKEIETTGKTIDDFVVYLETIFKDDYKVNFSTDLPDSNSVKIMTIHKSKGLEFPICYFAGFKKLITFSDLKDDILYDNKYGIILPYFNEYQKDLFTKELLKRNTKLEEISEKIRVLYVALTRAKEKMIIVTPNLDNEYIKISNFEKSKYKSFYEMINSIKPLLEKFITSKDLDIFTKDYLFNNQTKSLEKISTNKIEIEELNFEKEVIKSAKFSKSSLKLIKKEEQELMNIGNLVHEYMEYVDFNNPNYENIPNEISNYINNFITSKLIKENINSTFYKEYEFQIEKDNIISHGIIDLMIENDKEIYIIDYKLKNIEDPAYVKQLIGYKEVISLKTSKKITCYLYSIIKNEFKEV